MRAGGNDVAGVNVGKPIKIISAVVWWFVAINIKNQIPLLLKKLSTILTTHQTQFLYENLKKNVDVIEIEFYKKIALYSTG